MAASDGVSPDAPVSPRETKSEPKSTIETLCEGLLGPESFRAGTVKRLREFLEDDTRTRLDLTYLELEALPEAYFAAPRVISRLETLNCIGNQLTHLPPELGACVNLKELWCTVNQLKELPRELGACVNLEILRCDGNRLERLPPKLGACANLETLKFGNNLLKEFPPELGACVKLRILFCGNNPLKKGTPRTPQELRDQWAHLCPRTKSAEKA